MARGADESEERRLMGSLLDELRIGATAKPGEFVALDADQLIADAKARWKSGSREQNRLREDCGGD